jgi:hypothetical protein
MDQSFHVRSNTDISPTPKGTSIVQKLNLSILTAALIGLSGAAVADTNTPVASTEAQTVTVAADTKAPIVLSDAQMGEVVAGAMPLPVMFRLQSLSLLVSSLRPL